ncbi:hypothetical protein SAMN06264855_11719 [Halorubrum vacuolatum]|uniref:HVO-2833 C-terminal domain-containing protein n=1 Tax=Halorubrum vacuolatum TaxID=63740 RepID=A0A238XFY4_HALVU|nr:hypothetical protein SAMN06264855_11719 [Halorubrum vacuolatum]
MVHLPLGRDVDVDEAALREQAAKYGLEGEVDALLRYLKTHGEVDDEQLPEWDEFQKLATEYEIHCQGQGPLRLPFEYDT